MPAPDDWDEGRKALFEQSFKGYQAWAGLQFRDIGPGFAEVAFTPRAEMLTPWKTLNGAVINGLFEHPAFLALLTELKPGELAVTNDIFVQHLRPLPGDCEYSLRGALIRRGKTMAWTEVEAKAGGKTVSIARITKTIVTSR